MRAFREATYALSAHDPSLLPHDSRAEVAFVGRSNSGKSSAINALTSRRRLAHISRTPGRTQSINLYDLGNRRYLVDLPGYGFAHGGKNERADFNEAAADYLEHRPNLARVFVLIDSRLPPQRIQRFGADIALGGHLLRARLVARDQQQDHEVVQRLRILRRQLHRRRQLRQGLLVASRHRQGIA